MAQRTDVVKLSYECDNCGTQVPTKSWGPEDMPEGYFMQLLRVTVARSHNASGALFFCTKDCLLNAMKYRISEMTTIEI